MIASRTNTLLSIPMLLAMTNVALTRPHAPRRAAGVSRASR